MGGIVYFEQERYAVSEVAEEDVVPVYDAQRMLDEDHKPVTTPCSASKSEPLVPHVKLSPKEGDEILVADPELLQANDVTVQLQQQLKNSRMPIKVHAPIPAFSSHLSLCAVLGHAAEKGTEHVERGHGESATFFLRYRL